MMNHTYNAESKKDGMTIAEVQTFLEVALLSGTPAEVNLKAEVGFRGQLQSLTARKP